jgi:hypothetical protein
LQNGDSHQLGYMVIRRGRLERFSYSSKPRLRRRSEISPRKNIVGTNSLVQRHNGIILASASIITDIPLLVTGALGLGGLAIFLTNAGIAA